MDRTPSKPRAALWMAGWLAQMLIVVVAGRETTRELNVFQIMEGTDPVRPLPPAFFFVR
jgi:hypothetical protein